MMGKERWQEAQAYFEEVAAYARDHSDERQLALSMHHLSMVKHRNQDYQAAIEIGLDALKQFSLDDLTQYTEPIYGILQDSYAHLNDYQSAYKYLMKQYEIAEKRHADHPRSIIARAEADFLKRQMQDQAESYRRQNIELNESNRIITQKTEELESSHSKLKATNALLNRLVSLIAHDVRGPVANIAQALELISDGSFEPSEEMMLLKELHTSADLTSHLLDDLLLLIKNYATNQAQDRSLIDLDRIVSEVVNLYRPVARNKGITLTYEREGISVLLRALADHIKAILRNLLGNAIKYTPINGAVEIKLYRSAMGIHLSVIDSGVGMSKDQINALLNGCAKSTRGTLDERGFGLGLQFALEFIHLHNAKLNIDSSTGGGSTFDICFPN